MPKLISEIQNQTIKRWAEEEREKQNPGSTEDKLGGAFYWHLSFNEKYGASEFWYCVQNDNPALLSHPLYPKEETPELCYTTANMDRNIVNKKETVLTHLNNALAEIRKARFNCAGLELIQQMIKDKINEIK